MTSITGIESSIAYVIQTPHFARVTHANTFSRVVQGSSLHSLRHFYKGPFSHVHFMSHAQCSWLDRMILPLPHSTPSLLFHLNRSISCIPQQGVPFGRLAEHSPIAGYEPNGLVEVGSTEATTTLSLSRGASVGSNCNSGEDTATTLASSEVEERPYLEMLAAPQITREKECGRVVYHQEAILFIRRRRSRCFPWRCPHGRSAGHSASGVEKGRGKRRKPFCPKKRTEFCFCFCTRIELIVVCR